MGYDLYFRRERQIDEAEWAGYFGARPHYQLNGRQAFYANEDTGVYFSFDLERGGQEQPEEEPPAASFSLNYYRPHVFALEAAPEVEVFVQQFNVSIKDPQDQGMGCGPFSREGFLHGWNAGNELTCRAILNSPQKPAIVPTRPMAELERFWQWNYARAALQEELGQEVFVPKIMWFLDGAQVLTAVAWADGIAMLIPAVDIILAVRQRLAPRKLLRRRGDLCLITPDQAEQVLAPLQEGQYPLACRLPTYRQTPQALERFIRSLSPGLGNLQAVPPEMILNAELVEKVCRP